MGLSFFLRILPYYICTDIFVVQLFLLLLLFQEFSCATGIVMEKLRKSTPQGKVPGRYLGFFLYKSINKSNIN